MTAGIAKANLCHLTTPPRKGGRLLDLLLQVEAWLDARDDRQILYRLDSRALADIGLTESDLGCANATTSSQRLLQR